MEPVRLKAKGTAHKQCALVVDVASHRGTINSSDCILELNN